MHWPIDWHKRLIVEKHKFRYSHHVQCNGVINGKIWRSSSVHTEFVWEEFRNIFRCHLTTNLFTVCSNCNVRSDASDLSYLHERCVSSDERIQFDRDNQLQKTNDRCSKWRCSLSELCRSFSWTKFWLLQLHSTISMLTWQLSGNASLDNQSFYRVLLDHFQWNFSLVFERRVSRENFICR